MQSLPWTDFTHCAICTRRFRGGEMLPITLSCFHTVCHKCLRKQKAVCPLDRIPFKTPVENPPINPGIVKVLNIDDPKAVQNPSSLGLEDEEVCHYQSLCSAIERIAMLLSPLVELGLQGMHSTCLSRPILKKVATVLNVPLFEVEGRMRLIKIGKSVAERLIVELLLLHQKKQELSSQLWAALRQRGCQFLGPIMQYEALKVILRVLETGRFVSRKNIISFVVQQLEPEYPTASRTSVGHVVQLLYRASCFTVDKREGDSSLLQLKEEFRTYDTLRREHDTQIVKISMEAGLRIGPEQLANMLYTSSQHKPYIQSIIDKLIASGVAPTGINELKVVLERVDESSNLSGILLDLEFLISQKVDVKNDEDATSVFSFQKCADSMEALKNVLLIYVEYSTEKLKKQHGSDFNVQQALRSRYKTAMCREFQQKGRCSRGADCTYAHSPAELQRYREIAAAKSQKVQSSLHESNHHKHPPPDPADISHTLSSMTICTSEMTTHDTNRRSTIHSVDRELLVHDKHPTTTMAGLKQLSGSMLTGSDPGLLAEVANEYPDAPLKSYSSTSDLYSHHKYSVSNTTKYSASEQSLVEMGRDKVTEGSLSEDSEDMDVSNLRRQRMEMMATVHGPPQSINRVSLPQTYPHHQLPNYSVSTPRCAESHQTETYDTALIEGGWSHPLGNHTSHRLPAGSDVKYQVLPGSSTSVQYTPGSYPPQYQGVISTNGPRSVMATAPPFYPQYHVSSVGQPQSVNYTHHGMPIYPNLSTISETNVMTVDPRLPQISFKPPTAEYNNSFPVYVDPNYYTTYP